MVRFVDTATIIRKDSYEGNTDMTDYQTIGKKRVASTPHSKHLKGTKKHSSGTDGNEDDHPDEKIRSFFAKDIDSPNDQGFTGSFRNFETNLPADQSECRIDGTITEKVAVDNKNAEQNQMRSDGNKVDEKESQENSEKAQGIMEEGSTNDDSYDQNKRWEEFVDANDNKAAPNIGLYVNAKSRRIKASIRFKAAINECIQNLRHTANGIISEVVEPICNTDIERLDVAEENIIQTMVANHSRRTKLMEQMDNADSAWKCKYNDLTTKILNNNQTDQKNKINDGNRGEMENGKCLDASGSNLFVDDKEGQIHPRSLSTGKFSPKQSKEKSAFCHEDPDWEELFEYRPSRETILSFLDERDMRSISIQNIQESLNHIQAELESEVDAIALIASDLYNEQETFYREFEEEIECYAMENHERRCNLQKQLENSAQQAQGMFANLLSRLGQAAR